MENSQHLNENKSYISVYEDDFKLRVEIKQDREKKETEGRGAWKGKKVKSENTGREGRRKEQERQRKKGKRGERKRGEEEIVL